MASTYETLILQAFVDLGVIQDGDDVTAAVKNKAFLLLQQMLASWNTERPMNLVTHFAATPVAGTSVYSFGVGGTFNSGSAPIRVLSWKSTDGSNTSGGVALSYDEFRTQVQDGIGTSSKLPKLLTADRGNIISGNLIRIELWPTPAATPGALTLETIFALTPPAAVSDLATQYGPGFEMAIHYNLAVALAPQYARTGGVTPELAADAQNYKAAAVQASAEIQGLLAAPQAA